jgi:hypothetical protein
MYEDFIFSIAVLGRSGYIAAQTQKWSEEWMEAFPHKGREMAWTASHHGEDQADIGELCILCCHSVIDVPTVLLAEMCLICILQREVLIGSVVVSKRVLDPTNFRRE